MNPNFRTDASVELPALAHAQGCRCALHSRRRFGAVLLAAGAAPALAQDGLQADVGQTSKFAKFVPADELEASAGLQYAKMLREASSQKALGPAEHPQVVRLRAIADRLIPFTPPWNPRARQWKWEVNLIGSTQLNAFCMPGGKIAFYFGILQKLQLTDDEVATIMGHEMAHALREHARERMGKTVATRAGAGVLSALLGLGSLGNAVLDTGSQLLTLKFSRDDETEADIVGMDLAARSGYDPRAGVSLWNKMIEASKGAPPQFLSTHPSGPTRIAEIEAKLPKVQPLYAAAAKPEKRFAPPAPAAEKKASA